MATVTDLFEFIEVTVDNWLNGKIDSGVGMAVIAAAIKGPVEPTTADIEWAKAIVETIENET